MDCCDMKGYLSYLVLWILRKRKMTGVQIAKELEKRRGVKPSPGTIYPALKDLRRKGFIASDKEKVYSLTKKGEEELRKTCTFFCRMFYDINEMFSCCEKRS